MATPLLYTPVYSYLGSDMSSYYERELKPGKPTNRHDKQGATGHGKVEQSKWVSLNLRTFNWLDVYVGNTRER